MKIKKKKKEIGVCVCVGLARVQFHFALNDDVGFFFVHLFGGAGIKERLQAKTSGP